MTPIFFTLWFTCAAVIYNVLYICRKTKMDNERSFSTWAIIMAQSIGAIIAYAVY